MPAESYLLDTNVLIWLSSEIKRIPPAVLDVLESYDSDLYVSAVSYWELAIKQGLGKIAAAIHFDRIVEKHGMRELAITSKYASALMNLPGIHTDPFDRMLVAQAMADGLTLVTADRRLALYPVATLRV